MSLNYRSLSYGGSRARPRVLRLNWVADAYSTLPTYSGGVNGTRIDHTGTLVAAVCPRRMFDPGTLVCKGLRVEGTSTNYSNNTNVGAVVGAPGTPPTGWSVTTTGGVVTRSVVGVGTEAGMPYVDIRFQFSAAGSASLAYTGPTTVSALAGSVWTASHYARMVGGSLTNLACSVGISEFNISGTYIAGTSAVIAPTTAALLTQPVQCSYTVVDGLARYVAPTGLITASGAADVTIRIGGTQIEQFGVRTSTILNGVGQTTRTLDSISVSGSAFAAFYNPLEGTVVTSASHLPGTGSTGLPSVWAISTDVSNYMDVSRVMSTAQGRNRITTGGVSQFNSLVTSWPANTVRRVATAYAFNNCAAQMTGGTLYTDTSVTVPSVVRLDIGTWVGAAWNGDIQYLDYYGQRLPDAMISAFVA